jgi:hypothetical protein
MPTPKGLAHLGKSLPANVARGDAFKGVDERSGSHFRGHGNEEMEVVGLTVHFLEKAPEVGANL